MQASRICTKSYDDVIGKRSSQGQLSLRDTYFLGGLLDSFAQVLLNIVRLG